MVTDDLRDAIWGHLFQTQASKTVDELAAFAGRDVPEINAAVKHEWFTVTDDKISIAYTAPRQRQ